MATKQQYEQLIEQINANYEKLTEFQIEDLVRENELGSQLSFKDAESTIIKTIDLFNRAKTVNYEDVPYNLLNNFNNQLKAANDRFDSFKSFNPNQNNPVNQRDSLITQLDNQYDGYYQHTLPILTVGLLSGNDLSVQQAKIDQLVSDLDKKTKETEKKGEEYLTQLDETLKSAEEAAAKVGVSRHSQIFNTESTEHERQSKIWLKWTVGVLIAIVVAAIIFIFVFPDTTSSSAEIIQFSITKVIVLSAMFYGLSICNRNYKAHKHNATLNKHRQNALSTFETFAKAAGTDAQTKNAVLIEATHTIFSNQQTGYLNSEKDNESSNKIVEIIKNVATNKE
ncbi:hypothetical protein [Pontimicrobium aquaticum]|uniref:Uncharacterized protein n=1 Tax=Pontimicrobium aquaticum TaxID=2565367 RepID=A0A4U0ER27_9FLAO|nr:hypothetical protein [Pontimicrobium aquaticum]TJY34008.1 hypothetical protein E5167_11845 [Pontimicrobium aquaticum]